MKTRIFVAIIMMLFSLKSYAQQSEPIALYPNGIPNSKPAPGVYREKLIAPRDGEA